MQKNGLVIEKLVNWFVYGMFFLTIFTVVIALFSNETEGEAEIGSFQTDIVNIGLHFILKNVRPYAASCSEA